MVLALKKHRPLLGILLLTLLLVGCVTKQETPTESVTTALEALSKRDVETAQEYLPNEDWSGFSSDDPLNDELWDALFRDLTFEILSSREDGDRAIVEAKITNTDIGTVFTELFAEIFVMSFAQAFADEELELDDEFTIRRLVEMLGRENNPIHTATVDISLSRSEKKWVIDEADKNGAFYLAIYGGLGETLDAIGDAFSD